MSHKTGKLVKCPGCGKRFYAKLSKIRAAKWGTCCSSNCRYAARQLRTSKRSTTCGHRPYMANRLCKDCYWRNRSFLLKYGITSKDYKTLFRRQRGACAICGTKKPRGRWNCLHVDHDHRTGKVRGLLCFRCNTRLVFYEQYKARIERYIWNAQS